MRGQRPGSAAAGSKPNRGLVRRLGHIFVIGLLLVLVLPTPFLAAYRFLPLSALPEVDYPTIQVQTFYPGASPEVMTSSVTAPL